MADTRIAPYGSWTSPISTDMLVADAVRLQQIQIDGSHTYWLEGRASEGGRVALVGRDVRGKVTDVTPAEYNVRSRVHEYGGGAFLIDAGTAFFSNFADNRVYRQDEGAPPRPITPEAPLRYADFVADRTHGRLICVREDHSRPGGEAINTLVTLDVEGQGEGVVLVSGNDFYSSPRLSPDGSRLAWLTWHHPNLPWDGTELWTARVEPDGSLSDQRLVVGGPDESIFQPEWSPDGTLYFASDRTQWWNLYRLNGEAVEPVTTLEAEIGMPQWVFDMSAYGFVDAGHIYCIVNDAGIKYLATVDTVTGEMQRIPTPYLVLDGIRVGADRVVFSGASPSVPPEVVQLNLSDSSLEVFRRSIRVRIGPESISQPQPIEFPTEGGMTAHAFFYPPHNPDFVAPEGELPPLIVSSHGGPTGATDCGLELGDVQFWTSRGFAVVDVNYGGSTGYGRSYRRRLYGQWGVVDVDDCVNAAGYLAQSGLADPKRFIIHGGSAGGYTTLAALAFRDAFAAGCSYFGVGDLEIFVHDTHKFESRYLDQLVGPFPERRDVYRARSPIHYVDRISCPVIQFQGEDDKVVPPSQARLMQEALTRKGLPNAAIFFPGEGHGFRKAENIQRQFEGELYFYSRVFGFDLGEPVEPVDISNL